MKTKRTLTGRSLNTYELTDEIYSEMSAGQQLLASMCESVGIENPIAEYEGRYFVHNTAVQKLWNEVYD